MPLGTGRCMKSNFFCFAGINSELVSVRPLLRATEHVYNAV